VPAIGGDVRRSRHSDVSVRPQERGHSADARVMSARASGSQEAIVAASPYSQRRRSQICHHPHESLVLVILAMAVEQRQPRVVGDEIDSAVLNRVMLIVSFITPAVGLSPTLVTSKV
jgi:hypothetical protein